MASSSRGKNLEEAYAHLSLDNGEEEGFVFEDLPNSEPREGLERCLVGRIVSAKKVNFMAMQDTLASIWRPVKGVFMEETNQSNTFLFKFFHDMDMQRVLDDGPWTFSQQVLLVKKFNAEEQLKDVELSELYIWIQVYDVPIGFNSEFIHKSIGNYVGRFLDTDPKNFQGMCKNYLRIKVAIDIRKPLKKQMKIKKAGGEWLWIRFQYERLPSFCFYCGRIGHTEKFCEELFDNPQDKEVRNYDSSLRAAFRRQVSSQGNHWIRGADGAAIGLTGKERVVSGMEENDKGNSGNYAENNHDPNKSGHPVKAGDNTGGKYVMTVINGTGERDVVTGINADSGYHGKKIGRDEEGNMMGGNLGRREIKGITDVSSLKIISKIAEQTDGISKQVGDSDGPELNEILAVDLKRRRMGQDNEAAKKDQEQDVEMLNEEEINQNQKNGLLAGAAMQARLSS